MCESAFMVQHLSLPSCHERNRKRSVRMSCHLKIWFDHACGYVDSFSRDVGPCMFVDKYQRFGRTCCLLLPRKLIRHVAPKRRYLSLYTTSHPISKQSTACRLLRRRVCFMSEERIRRYLCRSHTRSENDGRLHRLCSNSGVFFFFSKFSVGHAIVLTSTTINKQFVQIKF
jgi:hypothetical protein